MGQQQLLLVILVTIIVGIATVVALNVFGTQADEANRDAVREDILGAAANAQGYYLRPEMMDGGGGEFTDMEIERLGIPGSDDHEGTPMEGTDGDWFNENGAYAFSGEPSGDDFTLVGVPASGTDDIEAVIAVCDGGTDGDEEVDIGWDGENPC